MKNKNGQIAFLICVGLIAIILLSMINIPMTSALPSETQYCDVEDCHENDEPTTWMDITMESQTVNEIEFYVTGSDNYDGEEGWAVFDPLMNNVANGNNSGYFILPKDGRTYRVFWVDNETDGTLGSAYEDIITPINNTPPYDLTLIGATIVRAGTPHSYTFTSFDNEEQDIFYLLEWGDGTDTGWFGPYESGEEDSKSHSWSEWGTPTIILHAKDELGAESKTNLVIEVPKGNPFNFNFNLLDLLLDKFPLLQRLLNLPVFNRMFN